MTVNISWLFRHSPQAQRSAVSNGCFCFQITGSGSAADLFTKTASLLTTSRGRSQEYDSGNDTSSPPSTQISSARSRGQEKGSPSGGLSKSRDLHSGNTSDSGNSFTTSSPQNKGTTLEHVSPTSRGRDSRSVYLNRGRAPALVLPSQSHILALHHPGSPSPPGVFYLQERENSTQSGIIFETSKDIQLYIQVHPGAQKIHPWESVFPITCLSSVPPRLASCSSRPSQSMGKNAIQLPYNVFSQPMEGKCLFPQISAKYQDRCSSALLGPAWVIGPHWTNHSDPGDTVFLARICHMSP